MPFSERADISIYYEEHGSARGFPIMMFPLGGLDATVERWNQRAFAPIEAFSEYRVIHPPTIGREVAQLARRRDGGSVEGARVQTSGT